MFTFAVNTPVSSAYCSFFLATVTFCIVHYPLLLIMYSTLFNLSRNPVPEISGTAPIAYFFLFLLISRTLAPLPRMAKISKMYVVSDAQPLIL